MNKAGVIARLALGPTWRLRAAEVLAAAEISDEVESVTASGFVPPNVASSAIQTIPEVVVATESPVVHVKPAALSPNLYWPDLIEAIKNCRACRLCEQRTQAVPGVGDVAADWLFVGEGPGAEEDLRGEPFVGQAGKLLDAMLASVGIARGNGVYIANSVKCRPPNNRTPEADEIEACFPYLERQIALIQPRVIVALGRPAAQALLKQEVRIGAARGQRFRYGDIPVVVTYHPAYLLRNPQDKGKAWEDLCFARKTLSAQAPRMAAPLSAGSLPTG